MTEKKSIRDQKLIYHLTPLENLPSIAENGLLPRSKVQALELEYTDIADQEIIASRVPYNLDQFVPFHFFAKNPFQGAVIKKHPGESFILITIHRNFARKNNFKILDKHPLSLQPFEKPELIDYAEGFEKIDWKAMDKRDYTDPNCKQVCMAECLSPVSLKITDFHSIYTETEEIQLEIYRYFRSKHIHYNDVLFFPNMFVKVSEQ
ncbi:MAG: DarT ssDNA thymidine ADP-ribosyltransferase family protein [Candidatus Wallbacteria bacterium]|nr:DarT ssDNA thymidine ADP-ribosyltransferase family protein [Candidatus Wallbacteria bacterium]